MSYFSPKPSLEPSQHDLRFEGEIWKTVRKIITITPPYQKYYYRLPWSPGYISSSGYIVNLDDHSCVFVAMLLHKDGIIYLFIIALAQQSNEIAYSYLYYYHQQLNIQMDEWMRFSVFHQ